MFFIPTRLFSFPFESFIEEQTSEQSLDIVFDFKSYEFDPHFRILFILLSLSIYFTRSLSWSLLIW